MITELKNFPKLIIKNKEEKVGLLVKELNLPNSYISSNNTIMFPPKAAMNFYSYNNSLALKKKGKLLELIFFGLNYNAKRIRYYRKPFVLDLQKSHKVKVEESRVSSIKTKIFKRRILFFSFERQKMTELVNLLKKQRPQNSYSGHGLILKTDNYSTKPGKVRQK